jgi:hypothetical protein
VYRSDPAGIQSHVSVCGTARASSRVMSSEPDASPESIGIALLGPVRRHVALVRTLLDELERIAQAPDASWREADCSAHLIEELERLEGWLRECAAAMKAVPSAPRALLGRGR